MKNLIDIGGGVCVLLYHCFDLFFQIALGPSGKAKRYCMKSGTREQFEENLVKQFPSEKIAISKLMKIVDVR